MIAQSTDFITEMLRILREVHGHNDKELEPTMRLIESGVIDQTEAKRYVVQEEFWRIYKAESTRTARDIELELSARYDVPVPTVRRLRRLR